MKGKFEKIVLEKLIDVSVGSVDLFIAFLNAGYGASYGKVMRELEKVRSGETTIKNKKSEEFKKTKRRFNQMVYYLNRDGLINKEGRGESAVFSITATGKKKLKEFKEKERMGFPDTHYSKMEGNKIILVSFDIPEQCRLKRDWIRQALGRMGFELLHQSVYLGRGKIPAEFINDLNNMKIIDFVEIIEISKIGTLRRVLK